MIKIKHIILAIVAIVILLALVFILCPITGNKKIEQPFQQDVNDVSNIKYDDINNLQKKNNNTKFKFYYFFKKTCPYCVNFEETWKKLFNNINVDDIQLIDIDTMIPDNEDIVFYYNITKTPTLILSTPDQVYEYEGNRELNNIVEFIQKYTS